MAHNTLKEDIWLEEESANDKWQVNKIGGIYLCELGSILIFWRMYLCRLKNVSKFCEFDLLNIFKMLLLDENLNDNALVTTHITFCLSL